MYRVSLMALVFSLLAFLTISCAPTPSSCPEGSVVDTQTGECIENTCVNFECGNNEHCLVDSQEGPSCVCDNDYLEINTENGMMCQKNPCINSNYDVCDGASCVAVKRNGRFIPMCGKKYEDNCPEGKLPVNTGNGTQRCVSNPCDLPNICPGEVCVPVKNGMTYAPMCSKN